MAEKDEHIFRRAFTGLTKERHIYFILRQLSPPSRHSPRSASIPKYRSFSQFATTARPTTETLLPLSHLMPALMLGYISIMTYCHAVIIIQLYIISQLILNFQPFATGHEPFYLSLHAEDFVLPRTG